VNARIGRLLLVLSLAFVVLIGTTSYWQLWAAPSLDARRDNPRLVYRQLSIDRGRILTSDGTVLAESIGHSANGRTIYHRRYPSGALASAVVGYASIQASEAGIERAQDDVLSGASGSLGGGTDLLGTLVGRTVRGDDVVLSLSARLQKVATSALRHTGHRGAVVAIEPSTGRVLAMVSLPSYDPNLVDNGFGSLLRRRDGVLLNRATQGLYPPGSTFKVVTAATALDGGSLTADSTFPGGSCITVFRPLCNASGEVAPNPNTLADALVQSYNTTFAQVGQQVGSAALYDEMQRFGFGSLPPLDYPTAQMTSSGIFVGKRRVASRSTRFDVARVAIGQGGLLVTPLQMAEVVATIANGGVVMAPHLVDRVRDRTGQLVVATAPQSLGRAISSATAATLTGIMRRVVDEGTGQAAQLGGLEVAGKTGTAQTARAGLNDAWFIAFAPASSPRIAIAVVVEDTTDFGGVIAAPIARDVIRALLGGG
jgi:peptidoglycan glycosyltransferase